MECKNCKYYEVSTFDFDGKKYTNRMCKITHICNPKSCSYLTHDKEVEDMNICYNCQYWHVCGDWGLSCEKDYYNCSANGFDKACDKFERK